MGDKVRLSPNQWYLLRAVVRRAVYDFWGPTGNNPFLAGTPKPTLKALIRRRLVELDPDDAGAIRQYYRPTPAGRAALAQED